MEFDIGPISRTETGGRKDSFSLAPLVSHEVMDALMAAEDRDEFVAWLWHDLFKPLFYFPTPKGTDFSWIHIPGLPPFDAMENKFAAISKIPTGLVRSHQGIPRKLRSTHDLSPTEKRLKYRESPIVEDQFDQTGLGQKARFIQLAFIVEPATSTMLLRAVIADAFMESIARLVAGAIQTQLQSQSPSFTKARYVFNFGRVSSPLSNSPTNAEIQGLANRYDITFQEDEIVITHFTPVQQPDFDGRSVEVVIDFTASPPTPERHEANILSLVELLTVYQDSQTILMTIPQFLDVDVLQLEQDLLNTVRQRLQDIDILTHAPDERLKKQSKVVSRTSWANAAFHRIETDIDLMAHVFAAQIKMRLIDHGDLSQNLLLGNGRNQDVRLLSDIVQWSAQGLQTKTRQCRLCGSPFDSELPPGEVAVGSSGAFSADFTDAEHIAFAGDMCPMCRVYELNSHQFTQAEKRAGKTGMRKSLRGSFALLLPSSHFTYRDDAHTLVEQPPLDVGGRFAGNLQRATFTLQEFSLFQLLSRRVISQIWQSMETVDGNEPLPLPYLGGIFLTQGNAKEVQQLFKQFEILFTEAHLWVYPFKTMVQPAIELAFEMTINDLQKHHTKHTYLKNNPAIITVAPESKFMVLVDNGLQMELSQQFFTDWKRIQEVLNNIPGRKRRRNWFQAVLHGSDPVTAVADAFYDQSSLWQAENKFWVAQMGQSDLDTQWETYEKLRAEINQIIARYPTFIEFL